MAMSTKKEILWKDRKRTLFGLPWSFTKYALTEDKLYVTTGLFHTKHEEIRLYRILDVSLGRTLGEKLFALGTIHLCSADRSAPELDLKRLKNSLHVRDTLSDLVEKQRQEKGIIGREFFGDESDHDFGMDAGGTHG